MRDRAIFVPKNPPPIPGGLDIRPHIAIGWVPCAQIDYEKQFFDFFPDFEDWCRDNGVMVGAQEKQGDIGRMFLAVHGDKDGLREYLTHWKAFFSQFFWLFNFRANYAPKLVVFRPHSVDMGDVGDFFPHRLFLHQARPSDFEPFRTFLTVSRHPMALQVGLRDEYRTTNPWSAFFRTEQDAVLARLSGLV